VHTRLSVTGAPVGDNDVVRKGDLPGPADRTAAVDVGALPNAGGKSVPHGLSDILRMVAVSGAAQDAAGTHFIPLPHAGALEDGGYNVQVEVTASDVVVRTTTDMSGYTGVVVLEYTAK
jgi:hypothetical protein